MEVGRRYKNRKGFDVDRTVRLILAARVFRSPETPEELGSPRPSAGEGLRGEGEHDRKFEEL